MRGLIKNGELEREPYTKAEGGQSGTFIQDPIKMLKAETTPYPNLGANKRTFDTSWPGTTRPAKNGGCSKGP